MKNMIIDFSIITALGLIAMWIIEVISEALEERATNRKDNDHEQKPDERNNVLF